MKVYIGEQNKVW